MTAGRGWIALALVVFATWKPWRVLAGAYLFGGVTLAQFQAQALGVDDPVAVPLDAAVCGDDRRAGAHFARRRDDPAQRAGVARPAVPPGRPERRYNRAASARPAPPTARSAPAQETLDAHDHPQTDARGDRRLRARRSPSRCRRRGPSAGEPLKIGFVYVSPIGDAGWTYQHDIGRKEMEKALGGKVTTKFVESVPEGADAERVIRELAQSGHKLIFTTSFGYMNPTIKVAQAVPEGPLRARDRLQDAQERRHLQRALLRRPLPGRHRRRQDDQDQRRRLCRRVSDPRGRDGHQRVHARHAQRQPEGRGEGRLGELVVRPGQGARGRRTR